MLVLRGVRGPPPVHPGLIARAVGAREHIPRRQVLSRRVSVFPPRRPPTDTGSVTPAADTRFQQVPSVFLEFLDLIDEREVQLEAAKHVQRVLGVGMDEGKPRSVSGRGEMFVFP